jgi:hypothetical protein
MVLAAPGGSPNLVTVGHIGVTAAGSFGSSSDYSGTYNFTDSAVGANIWTAAAATPIPAGNYRTTVRGMAGTTNPPTVTSLNSTFSGLTSPQANGTWTLTIRDGGGGDTGTVTAANLTVTGTSAPLDANADFNGDGKTDFIVARATLTPLTEGATPGMAPIRSINQSDQELKGRAREHQADPLAVPLSPPIYWYSSINGTGTTSLQQWGDAASDFIVTEDFDGDGKDDITVWREAPPTMAAFYILQSGTGTLRVETFGQTGDDPAVVGDYDGDGKADPAVFRCPAAADPAGDCYFFYRGSLANPSGTITYVKWGFGNDGDFFPYVGDFDGDGKNDFCIQRTNPNQLGQGQFVLLKSNGLGIEYINWGNDSDFLIPGDYDGDGKTDICVRRTVSGLRQHFLLTRTGATSQVQWGITGDASVPGDYDGDGKTDFAVWRPSTDPTQNFFWVLNSSNSSVSNFEWGQCPAGNCDFAVAGWAVH